MNKQITLKQNKRNYRSLNKVIKGQGCLCAGGLSITEGVLDGEHGHYFIAMRTHLWSAAWCLGMRVG